MLVSTLLIFAGLVSFSAAGYVLEDDYAASSFFSMFDFFTSGDPTNGYVTYLDQTAAQSGGLINTNNGQVYMGVDYKNVASGSGRSSVRLSSKKSYNHGLVILDLAHMPGGICGTWPAFWMVGPNWPTNGEIDIIEGVNSQSSNSMTLHTSPGCSIVNNGMYSGSMTTSNCDVNAAGQAQNAGCQINTASTSSFGSGFNSGSGGVYATEWTSEAISIWFFPHSAIPSDISSGNPNPANWGVATASFSGGCDIDSSFKNQQIVFDTTFCGDWAGAVWSTDSICSSKASTCQSFVQNNPSAFANAYWSVNSLKVYQANGATPSAAPSSKSFSFASVASSISSSIAPSLSNSRTQSHSAASTPEFSGFGQGSGGVAAAPSLAKVASSGNTAALSATGGIFAVVLSSNTSASTALATTSGTGGVFAVISSSNAPISTGPATTSPSAAPTTISSTFTSTITTNPAISSVAPSTQAPAASSTRSTTFAGGVQYVTVSALDSWDFPSSGETQTAGVPVPHREWQHLHRHIGRHQKKNRVL